ncbi:uncharacterized protein LOC135846331 isoform X2 [Planococcus citri]|uniref:uncharacterized protein LOC135846331 isoform X2 n=1 Tax=Planococcus citri TaxID=170843 RepID=UPI0031FA42AC
MVRDRDRRCCACGNSKDSLFRIPKDNDKRILWLLGCGIDLSNSWALPEDARICSGHFRNEDFTRSSDVQILKQRLYKGAVPSIIITPMTNSKSGKHFKKNCFVCGLLDNSENRSFHLFPRNSELKNQWLQNLGIENCHRLLTDNHRICSIHFSDCDFIGKNLPFRKKTLRKKAVPFNVNPPPVTTRPEVHNENHTKEGDDTLNATINLCDVEMNISETTPTTDFDCQTDASDLINEVETFESSVFTKTRDVACQVDVSNLFVLGGSQQSHSNIHADDSCVQKNQSEDHVTLSTSRTTNRDNGRCHRIFAEPRYVGDIQSPHLSDLRRAKKYLNMTKAKIKSQSKVIETLQKNLNFARRKNPNLR